MKILLRYCGLNDCAAWRGLVETQIRRLEGLAAIAAAHVTLERQHEFTPAFRVLRGLEVPGPDVHAEARDHTLQAALLKVRRTWSGRFGRGRSRRGERRKTNLRLGLIPGDVS